jgi:PGF-CTERM protein
MADADVSSATFEFAVETAENVETDARETTQSAETDGGDGDDTGGSGPGFTPVLTVLALVGAALLARRS